MSDSEKKNTGKTVVNNMAWRFAERCGAQIVTFVVSVVLARILDPEAYGTIALITVFTTLLQVFVDSGLGNALIQKKDADDLDFSTVFYFNILMCAVLYGGMYFAAPLIAAFYEQPDLTDYVRVLSVVLILSGVKNVQQAYVSRNMMFRRFFFATIGGTIGAAVVGIWMAWMGYGVWALIAQNVFNQAVGTIILWLTVKWRPRMMFSWSRLKGLFSYSWKLLAANLIQILTRDLWQLIIGKLYSSDDLAFYNKGQQFPDLIVQNVNTSIDSVLLPAMSTEQDNKKRVYEMTRRSVRVSSYIMWPLMVGMAVCSPSIVSLVLTDKWLPCVPFMRIFCVTMAFYPIHTANLNAIKAVGRSDLLLKMEIMKDAISIATAFATMHFGVMVMAYSMLFTSLCSQIINSWPNRKLLGYRYSDQVKDMLPAIGLSLGMGAAVWGVELLGLSALWTLLIQVPLGVVLYILGSVVLKIDSFNYILNMLRSFLKK